MVNVKELEKIYGPKKFGAAACTRCGCTHPMKVVTSNEARKMLNELLQPVEDLLDKTESNIREQASLARRKNLERLIAKHAKAALDAYKQIGN